MCINQIDPEIAPDRFRWERLRGTIIPVLACLLLFACSVNVKKQADGQEKQVDINTPVGGIHVGKQVDASDVGIAVYPGARPKDTSNESDKNANVNISSFGFGLKVVAMKYESDDSPAKIVAFYKDQLKKYGNVLECHSSSHVNVNSDLNSKSDGESSELTCGTNVGNNIELKVGTKDNQHVVAVEPGEKGSTFALVYVRVHGKQTDI
jgi:hypothetical protein